VVEYKVGFDLLDQSRFNFFGGREVVRGVTGGHLEGINDRKEEGALGYVIETWDGKRIVWNCLLPYTASSLY
jgi:hypothetical protein